MTFSDDDLKRLKEDMNPEGFTSNEAVIALINRMEAGERMYYKHGDSKQCDCGICEDWRKACGQ